MLLLKEEKLLGSTVVREIYAIGIINLKYFK
jgi:hypothetical protein